jgi:nucleoside-diphosphate-sugar epimerase
MNSSVKKKKVLVTGGAGFIGCNLVRRLLKEGAYARVFDNFSTGKRDNLRRPHWCRRTPIYQCEELGDNAIPA